MKSFSDSKELLFDAVDRCMVCGRDVFDGRGICEVCHRHLVYNNSKTCERCGAKVIGETRFCSDCANQDIFFDKGYSVFVYEDAIKSVIYALKYGNREDNAITLARCLADKAIAENILFDVVVGVPMTKSAEKLRGYNQSYLLAKHFCDIIKVTFLQFALVKTKETDTLEKISHRERWKIMQNVFKVADKTAVCGKNILLIDDVKTSGATGSECARALKKGGANKVYLLTVASREEKVLTE